MCLSWIWILYLFDFSLTSQINLPSSIISSLDVASNDTSTEGDESLESAGSSSVPKVLFVLILGVYKYVYPCFLLFISEQIVRGCFPGIFCLYPLHMLIELILVECFIIQSESLIGLLFSFYQYNLH